MGFEHSQGRHPHARQDQGQHHEQHHDHFQRHRKACGVSTSEEITITTPVVIHAYANSAQVELTCGGHEIIQERCHGRHYRKFKIRQKIHACIPIEFVAECEVGDGEVEFEFSEE